MEHSNSLKEISKALCATQKEVLLAHKDAKNPFFKSTYSTLKSTWDALREPFSKNGISVFQHPCSDNGATGLTTLMMHTSGEYIRESVYIPLPKNDPQSVVAYITYLRRACLQSSAGVCPADDDAESITNHQAGDTGTGQKPTVVSLQPLKPPAQNLMTKAERQEILDIGESLSLTVMEVGQVAKYMGKELKCSPKDKLVFTALNTPEKFQDELNSYNTEKADGKSI